MKYSEKVPCIYILASKRNGTLYTGITSDLLKRITEHKSDTIEGFTKKYGVHTLVYFEVHETMRGAIEREKQIKAGSRKKKIALIESKNPRWEDLYGTLL
ncbi:MAG: GIY-YIG nuclease family protein [Candidatus Yonathbacteria bacterium]|nr:GIY-YIG nuclease family protein [Candidatus Yonathbacteria bacterium]